MPGINPRTDGGADGASMGADIPADTRLKRRYGPLTLTLLGIGASVGSGIFVVTGFAAHRAGPAVAACFAASAVICAANGLCYAELASRFPVSGGIYVFTYNTFGRLPALIVVVNLLIDYYVGAAVLARSFVSYALVSMPASWTWLAVIPVNGLLSLSFTAPCVTLLLTGWLARGAAHGTSLNNALTALKLTVVLLVLGAGARLITPALWSPFVPSDVGAVELLQVSALVFFSYTGFDAIANAAEECVEPQRSIPVAIVACVCVCAVLYVSVSLLIIGVVPRAEIDISAPIAQIFADGRGVGWEVPVVSLGAAVGLLTTLLVGMYAQARTVLGLARDLSPADDEPALACGARLMQALKRVSATRGTPVNAQLLCGAIATALAAVLDVHLLTRFLSAGVLLSYCMACACALSLRLRRVDVRALRRWPVVLAACAASCVLGTILARVGVPAGAVVCVLLATLASGHTALAHAYTGRRERDAAPAASFSMPLVPLLPLGALCANCVLIGNLPWEALVRLAVVTLATVALRGWVMRGAHLHPQPLTVHQAGDDIDNALDEVLMQSGSPLSDQHGVWSEGGTGQAGSPLRVSAMPSQTPARIPAAAPAAAS